MEGWEAGLSLSPTWPSTQGMHAGGQKLGAENQVQGGVCHLPPANSRLPGKHLDLSEPIPPLVKWKITRATRFAELLYGSLWASLVALKAQAIQINSFKKKKKITRSHQGLCTCSSNHLEAALLPSASHSSFPAKGLSDLST